MKDLFEMQRILEKLTLEDLLALKRLLNLRILEKRKLKKQSLEQTEKPMQEQNI